MGGEGGGDAEAVDQVGEDGGVVFWRWGGGLEGGVF